DASLLQLLLQQGVFPLISSIGLSQQGDRLNVNADDAAVAVAQALGAKLILLSNVSGVLDQDKNLMTELNQELADTLIQQEVITDGMIVKVKSALAAATSLGGAVSVASWKDLAQFKQVLAGKPFGTTFLPESIELT
ncbi:MAG: acetylglutamate kinase, partial [Vibrio sp.]